MNYFATLFLTDLEKWEPKHLWDWEKECCREGGCRGGRKGRVPRAEAKVISDVISAGPQAARPGTGNPLF